MEVVRGEVPVVPGGIWLEVEAFGKRVPVRLIDGEPHWAGNLIQKVEAIRVVHSSESQLPQAEEIAIWLRSKGWYRSHTCMFQEG